VFGVKFFLEAADEFLKFDSAKRNLVFLFNFMDQSAGSHVYIVPKPHIFPWNKFLSSGTFSQGRDRQKLITEGAPVTQENSLNFVFSREFVLKSMSSICMLLRSFIVFCLLSKHFINVKIQSSSLSNHTVLQKFQMCLAINWYLYFQCNFSIAIISKIFNLLL